VNLSQEIGTLNVAKEMKYNLESLSTTEYSFDNDSDEEQTFAVPDHNYDLIDSAS
jgi:hypothetical protein